MRHILSLSESSLGGVEGCHFGVGGWGCLSIDEATPHPNEGWGVRGCLFVHDGINSIADYNLLRVGVGCMSYVVCPRANFTIR